MPPQGPPMTGHDRRVFVRARVVATATAWVRGICKGSYIVENLSLGGVQLSGGPAIRVGEEIKLIVELPHGSVEVRGLVLRSDARTRDAALALRFHVLSRRARDSIGSAVAEALEEAARDSSLRPEPTVLVVDDSLLIRESLTRDIRRAGWEVACFSTTLDALDFLDRPESRIRVALVDLVRANEGKDLLNFLAEEKPAIRRVLMSDEGRLSGEALETVATRANAVLAKPWDLESLARTLMPESGSVAAMPVAAVTASEPAL
jgi:ActR/RegA family two-component response regulator